MNMSLEYFYKNHCLINGQAPTIRDVDRAYFLAFEHARKTGKKMLLIQKRIPPQ